VVDVLDLLIGALALTGALLVVLAGLGLIRFGDVYARMHAATKVPTLGLSLVAISAALALDDGRAKILIAVVFVFITAPSGAHLLGRAAYRAEGIEIDVDARDDLEALLDATDDEPDG
jgi:multicomponent Na+:H+ antiporter subunit G